MKPSPVHPSGWNRGRIAVTIGAIFVLQIGLLWIVGARPSSPAMVTTPNFVWRLAPSELSQPALPDWLWAGDPTLFALAAPNGFSGGAWMNQEIRDYELPGLDEPPLWLALNPEWLDSGLDQLVPREVAAARSPDHRSTRRDATEILVPAVQIPTRSVLRMDDNLKARLEDPLPGFPPWPSKDVIPKSVVQITVDGTGLVGGIRLLRINEEGGVLVASPTRSVEADQLALRIANGLRFRPVNSGPEVFEPIVGKLTFDWVSDGLPPAATNTVSSPNQ